MAKALNIGISDVARVGKKGWIGVDEKARKIKKMWIGDADNKARLFFSGGELQYYGTTTENTQSTHALGASASVGNYAIFFGGNKVTVTDVYNTSLTRLSASAPSISRYSCRSTNVGNYAIFAGGRVQSGVCYTNVDAYNSSLTKSVVYLDTNSYSQASVNHANHAVIAGGFSSPSSGSGHFPIASVVAFDESLTKTTLTSFATERGDLAGTTIGEYALFGGGCTILGAMYSSVTAYDTSFTRTFATSLGNRRRLLSASNTENYAIFAGGTNDINDSSAGGVAYVDAYDTSLTKVETVADLSYGAHGLASASIGGYVMFGGGRSYANSAITGYSNVDIYDNSLTRTSSTPMSVIKSQPIATTLKDYVLFGGNSTVIDVYQLD